MVSIAHWLDTFTCSKYADRFERSGYLNLQSVCHLTAAQLQSLGIANNDIYTIMENIFLLKQSVKSINSPPRHLDLNSEPPPSIVRSRTASPAINNFNRNMNQNPTAYSPGPNVSTPPASSGPSPDRGLPGPSPFDTPSNYHRSNSFPNPVNPNTFFDVSPTSSTSSPHRSTSIDNIPPPMEGAPYNDYLPQPSPHQFQPPGGMIYRGGNNVPGAGGNYYNPPPPRFYSPEQQQAFMYSNPRMMMQQHPSWGGHRPPLPPPSSSHQMHYNPYEHHQFRMAQSQQFCHPNHPIMSDQNQMFMNQQQSNMNSSSSNKLSNSAESHPHPLQSLERLVLLPESQVIDPKSVVNEIHDPQSPFSESLSPYGTLSPKNTVGTPPTATIVSNLLTNEKSILEQHTKASSGLKRSSTHDERNDLNKKNRMNTTNDLNTGDSIINNHPVVTSLLTRGLNNSTSQAPLPSIKSLQQKHNPSFIQQQQQQRQQQMIFPPNQPDPQQFVDGLTNGIVDETMDVYEQDYEQLMIKLRLAMDKNRTKNKLLNLNTIKIPSQLDGVSDPTDVTSKSSRKHDSSTSSDHGTSNSENQSSSVKNHLDKSTSDPTGSSQNGTGNKCDAALNNNHKVSYKRRLSDSNLELNHSINGHHSNSISSDIKKPKVIQSPTHSDIDHEANSSFETVSQKITTDNSSCKPIREAKKRSLIYTGNTREFLETAIAAGIMDDIGDEEDEDNEYVPPGGTVTLRPQPSSSSSENEDESTKSSDDSSNSSNDDDKEEEEDDDDDDEEEKNHTDDNQDEKNSGTEMILNEEPTESGINWNVRNRPQRRTHLIRFDNISQQDEQQFFGALQEQVPELAAYLNEDSDDEYDMTADEKVTDEVKTGKSSTKKSRRTQNRKSSEPDSQTDEIMKKFRHVNVPVEKKKPNKKSHVNESTVISMKNVSDELYVILNDNSPRTIVSGTHLDTTGAQKKNSTVQAFNFHRRQIKMNTIADTKAPWRCVFCWKEPYEEYLGPLFGPFQLNEQCRSYLNHNKQLAKHYRKLIEVWLHRDCALWNNHIQMNPTTGELMQIPDACSIYLDITCSICQIPGAALACRYRNCKVRYHYPCAKMTLSCRLVEESYSVYCPKHNQINKNKSNKNHRKTMTGTNDSQESLMT
ncbi:unnamed protein product [Rotaria socialis]|uniref:PHD-type domain-containing protein n=1 Tax=Rotaria socialis TaxID=392032 RepID=A0A818JD94_9BILA|nr:unnamed protein product [Rotaria socialis]CAF4733050.1 unnamed protein product [Rotaria socialis]